MAVYTLGLITFGLYARQILATQRRRKVPTAALHLLASHCVGHDHSGGSNRDLGLEDFRRAATSSLLAAVSGVSRPYPAPGDFILPSTRPRVPEQRDASWLQWRSVAGFR